MTLAEVIPIARKLSPSEKLKLIRILAEDLDDRQEALEDDEVGFNAERFRESYQQAIAGNTLPLSQLWED
jgi:hypothetical protein